MKKPKRKLSNINWSSPGIDVEFLHGPDKLYVSEANGTRCFEVKIPKALQTAIRTLARKTVQEFRHQTYEKYREFINAIGDDSFDDWI